MIDPIALTHAVKLQMRLDFASDDLVILSDPLSDLLRRVWNRSAIQQVLSCHSLVVESQIYS